MVRQRDLAGAKVGGTATQEADLGDGMMRRAERTGAQDAVAAREQAGHRVQLRGFERLLAGESREDRRHAPGQHRLSRAGRPDEQYVVASCAGNLEGAPSLLLAADVREIDRRPNRGIVAHRRRGLIGRPRAPEETHYVGEGRGAHDVQTFDLGRLASVGSGNDDALQPLARSLDRHGQQTGRRHELSLERQLSGECVPGEEGRGHLGGGCQHAERALIG